MEIEAKLTLDAADSLIPESRGKRRRGAEVKGSNLSGTSSDELQAESRPYESESTRHHEGLPLYPFVFAQVHSSLLFIRSHLPPSQLDRRFFRFRFPQFMTSIPYKGETHFFFNE